MSRDSSWSGPRTTSSAGLGAWLLASLLADLELLDITSTFSRSGPSVIVVNRAGDTTNPCTSICDVEGAKATVAMENIN